MKNTPKIGWVSNFWGAVHLRRSFFDPHRSDVRVSIAGIHDTASRMVFTLPLTRPSPI
jgi:hypothetical protein